MSSIKGRKFWRSNYKDLIGKTVGRLKVLEWDGVSHKDNRRRFICLCECGNKHITRGEFLITERVKSCGCLRNSCGNEHKDWSGEGCIPGTTYSNIKRSAKNRNYDFSISLEFLWNLYLKQNGRCGLSGIPIKFNYGKDKGNASLDRIDNNVGYIEPNVRWVDKDINLIKRTLSDEQLFDHCRNILKTNNRL